jgi:hypothetical protein
MRGNKKPAESTQPDDLPTSEYSERDSEFYTRAQMLAAREVALQTTDELVAADYVAADYYNPIVARIGINVRLRVGGPALPDAPPNPSDARSRYSARPKFYDWCWTADGWGVRECRRAVDAYRTAWRAIVEAGRREIAERLAMFNLDKPHYWPGPRGGAWAILGKPYEPPPAPCCGIHFVELRPGALEDADRKILGYGPFSDIHRLLRDIGKRGPTDHADFNKRSKKNWNARLRKRVTGKAFDDLVTDCHDAADRAELSKQAQRKRLARVAARWDRVLTQNGVTGVVPAHWPMRCLRCDLFVPKAKPHNDSEHGRSNKGIALGAYTPFPPRARSSRARRVEITPDLQQHYLERLRSTLSRETWNDPQLDTRIPPTLLDEVDTVEDDDDE